MSIEPEKIPEILHTHTPRLVADLRHTIGDLVPLDQHEGLVEETVRSIYQLGKPIDGDMQQEADWLSEQVQKRVLESFLKEPYPPAFSAASERLLASLLRLRHSEAFTLLLPYAPRLDSYIAKTFPAFSQEERADIVHDTLVRAFEKGKDFDPALSSLKTWLITQVRYRALDDLRLHISPSDIDRLADKLEDAPTTSAESADEQPSAAMDTFIRQLPSKRAEAVRKYYYEGRSFAEIAREMNTSEVTVRANLSRARKDLERLIGDNLTFLRYVAPVLLAFAILITAHAVYSRSAQNDWNLVRWFTGIAEAPSAQPATNRVFRVFLPQLAIAPVPSVQPSRIPTRGQPSATLVPMGSPTSTLTRSPASTPTISTTRVPSAMKNTQEQVSTFRPTMAATLVPAANASAPRAPSKPTSSPTSHVAHPLPRRGSVAPTPYATAHTNEPAEAQSASATATHAPRITPMASTSSPTMALTDSPTATPSLMATASATLEASATPVVPISSPTLAPSATATPSLMATASATLEASATPVVLTSSPTITTSPTATPNPTATASATPEAPAPCTVYGIHDGGHATTQLVTIEANTRTVRAAVPAWHHADIRDIAFRPGTSELYAVSGDEGTQPGSLFHSDLTTGELTLIGKSGFGVISAIAFHPSDGSLWAWIKGAGLARIDLNNGAATLVYRSSIEIDGLVWSTNGTRLYGAYEHTLWVYEQGHLQREATNLPGLTQAIGWDSAGHLIGTYHQDSAFTLFTYDLATHHVRDEVQIASEYEDIDGLAWPASCGILDP